MSYGIPFNAVGWSPGAVAASLKAAPHEARASFRPAGRPGRRATEAGLDRQDLADDHEQTRKSGTRRRERLFVEQGHE